MSDLSVLSERVGDVGVLTLNRPGKMNAIDRDLIESLESAIKEARDDGVRALLLTGAGRGFCTGADLTAPPGQGHTPGTESLAKKGMPLGYPSLLLQQFPRPTIAAVNGAAVGAGFGLALACAGFGLALASDRVGERSILRNLRQARTLAGLRLHTTAPNNRGNVKGFGVDVHR